MIGLRQIRIAGFTLIEVLVAMAILAVAMAALTRASGDNAANATYLRDRTVAMWVAENRMTDLQLSNDWVRIGKSNGEVEMAGHTWHWRMTIGKLGYEEIQPYLRSVKIEVRLEEDQQSANAVLHGFVGNPRIGGS
ncbi:MAG: type II secretion system minor pseudopilin GspI [Pseudomonadota bacterium]